MWDLGSLVDIVGAKPDIQQMAETYGHLGFLMIPFRYLLVSFWDFGITTYEGAHRGVIITSFIGLLIGIIANGIFIYGGALTWIDHDLKGFRGSPLATTVSVASTLIITVIYFWQFLGNRNTDETTEGFFVVMSSGWGRAGFCDCLVRYAETGLLKTAGMMLQSGVFLTLILCANYTKEAQVDMSIGNPLHMDGVKISPHIHFKLYQDPVNNIAALFAMLTFYQIPLSILNGLAVACSHRLSIAVSDKNVPLAWTVVSASLSLALLFALPFMVCFSLGGDVVAKIFTTDSHVVKLVQGLTPWMAITVCCDAVTTVIAHGVFPELLRTQYIVLMRFFLLCLFAPMAYYVCVEWSHGVEGLFILWAVASFVLCVMATARLLLSDWKLAAEEAAAKAEEHKTSVLQEEAKPILSGKGKSASLAPDYIQSNRDSPHMIAMRAGGAAI